MKLQTPISLCVFFAFVMIAQLTSSYVSVFYHENAHERVAEEHGCIDGVKHIGIFGGDYQCKNWSVQYIDSLKTDPVRLQETQLQAFTEVFGYHQEAFLFSLFMAVMALGGGIILAADIISGRKEHDKTEPTRKDDRPADRGTGPASGAP